MKRKLSLSMALILLLILTTGAFAVTATYRGITGFLDDQDAQNLNPDYLMHSLQQSCTGHYLDGRVVDAYWDGARLSIACHFTPKDAGLTVAAYCHCRLGETENHTCPNETADLSIDFTNLQGITIAAENETARPYRLTLDRVQETDVSLSVMLIIVVNDLSKPVTISLPITVHINSTGETAESQLQFSLPALPDPIPEHPHEWIPARCNAPQTCYICGRTQGGLGEHDFSPATCTAPKTCTICGVTVGTRSSHHSYDENGICPLCGKAKHHSPVTP